MDVLNLGRIFRDRPTWKPDADDEELRIGRYREQYVQNLANSHHGLCDEGSYFSTITPTPGTGIIQTMTATLDNTKPSIVIYNNDVPAPNGKRIYLDYIKMMLTVVGGGTPTINYFANYLDTINRWGSAGTKLIPANMNSDFNTPSVADIYTGAITGVAASAQARLVNSGVVRSAVNVVYDTYVFKFGCIESNMVNGNLALATAENLLIPCPPVVIGGRSSFELCQFNTGETTTGKTYTIEVGWWER